ncbi:L-dopachrome tautomerase-related protein [Neptunomonas qingdaonensis]|uniref:Major royal jelly protein n=1 Tax=Neptunomonas qingdaonensis TaxID=1045558 RepID=A0A1I2V1E4_9GAMM|nr:L-dopachrome tautomerase-related protein [Neptunomonas qingdaonensis]SFG83032.1 Major royal jelly protein [Neptunomonas qingdaonensis]
MPFSKLKIAATLAALVLNTISVSVAAQELSTYAKISDTRPGNITITSDNRVIITQQPLDGPSLRVVEVKPDGSKVPFPTLDWADGPEKGKVGITATIGITTASNDVVWILDMGGTNTPAQLVAWDSKADRLHKVIEIPASVKQPISFLQDFVLDEKHGKIYIADMTFTAPASAMKPAFVVVDIETGQARRVLEADSHLMPVEHDVMINGALMGFKAEDGTTQPWHLAMNAIAIDPAFEYVYFGSMNSTDVFRIATAALADEALDDAALTTQIERYADKRPNDGFIVDAESRVVSGDIETSAITRSGPKGLEILAQDDKRLRWPDGFAFGPDGTLYITANQLNTHPALNGGVDSSDKEYFILTLKP